MNAITLRPYQSDMVDGIRAAFRRTRRVLAVAPTGAGKTRTFAYIGAATAARGKRVYIQAHRNNIIDQISKALDEIGVRHGRIQAGHSLTSDLVQIAMIQTLAKWLHRLPAPDLIVTDEAHHAASNQCKLIFDAWPEVFSLGVTATPERSDGKGLDDCYDELVMGPQMSWLIANGFLAPYTYLAPPQQVDLSGIKTRMGDFAIDQVADAMDRATITGDSCAHYRTYLKGRPAIAFCVTIAHAEHVAEQFRAAGYNAASVDGKMDRAEQNRRLAAIGNGGLNVLTSCQLIGEGTDIPAVAGVLLLNPTKSIVNFLQPVGRSLRLKPDGSGAIILDHVGNVMRHGMPDAERDWSLKGRPPKQEAPAVKQCKECFAIYKPTPVCPECGHSTEKEDKVKRELEVIAGELAEIDAARLEAIRKTPLSKLLTGHETLEELKVIRKEKGYHPGWIRHQLRERHAHG